MAPKRKATPKERQSKYRENAAEFYLGSFTAYIPEHRRAIVSAVLSVERERWLYEMACDPRVIYGKYVRLTQMNKPAKIPTVRDLDRLEQQSVGIPVGTIIEARKAIETADYEREAVTTQATGDMVEDARQVARAVTATRLAAAMVKYLESTLRVVNPIALAPKTTDYITEEAKPVKVTRFPTVFGIGEGDDD